MSASRWRGRLRCPECRWCGSRRGRQCRCGWGTGVAGVGGGRCVGAVQNTGSGKTGKLARVKFRGLYTPTPLTAPPTPSTHCPHWFTALCLSHSQPSPTLCSSLIGGRVAFTPPSSRRLMRSLGVTCVIRTNSSSYLFYDTSHDIVYDKT